ncbi:hypothetical protein SLS58_007423 [Diplodia intermedia]|uniref:2EXR domain-containing protein n=1 Tax=Diplodia intermedia TaxID=856260 RepID=A0ABR3TKS2_9PEZI
MADTSLRPSDIERTNQDTDAVMKVDDIGDVEIEPELLQIFPWDKLPAELRIQICELSLAVPHPLIVDEWLGRSSLCHDRRMFCSPPDLDDHRRSCKHAFTPSLLRINKETYKDAMPIMYANELHFSDNNAFSTFLHTRRPAVLKHVKKLILRDIHWRLCRDMVGLVELDSLAIAFDDEEGFAGEEEHVESWAWEIFSTAYWYLKSLAPEKAKSIVRLDPTTRASIDKAGMVRSEDVEERVRARVLELLRDLRYDIQARACAGGDYPDPMYPLDPPTRYDRTWQ